MKAGNGDAPLQLALPIGRTAQSVPALPCPAQCPESPYQWPPLASFPCNATPTFQHPEHEEQPHCYHRLYGPRGYGMARYSMYMPDEGYSSAYWCCTYSRFRYKEGRTVAVSRGVLLSTYLLVILLLLYTFLHTIIK